jgi:hypothetical protein
MLKDQTRETRTIGNITAGFPKISTSLSSYGRIKALIVPVDFSDLQGVDDTLNFFSPIAKKTSEFYASQSYGKVVFDFDIVPNWVRMPFLSTAYKRTQVGAVITGDVDGYVKSLLLATDGPIDFNKYETIYFLVPKEMPESVMQTGPTTYSYKTNNAFIGTLVIGGADSYRYLRGGSNSSSWRWMSHETGHQFGMFDEVNAEFTTTPYTLGSYSLMGNNSLTVDPGAIELVAWDRYVQGWMSNNQFSCITLNSLSGNTKLFNLTPIERQSNDLKSIMIPLSLSKILVIESRKNEGFDHLSAFNEGVLVYTVDMTSGTHKSTYVIQSRIGTKDTYYFSDGLLKAGDSITVENIKISVQKLSSSGDTVLVSYQ